MLISVASGKGGTGKTTLALLLASVRPNTTLLDCDVEEPNCHLFLKPEWNELQEIHIMIPSIDSSLCTGCGDCKSACLFNAIAIAGEKAMLFDELCHSCGGCLLVCPHGAVREEKKKIGTITFGKSSVLAAINLISGTLEIGIPSSVPLIKAIRKKVGLLTGDILIDCPPGTSCSMAAAVKHTDYCVLVTEPTPFGKHDLELAINITALLQVPTGVVINKCDHSSGDKSIEELCRQSQVPILAKIPHSHRFAGKYAEGILSDEFNEVAGTIWRQIGKAEDIQP